MSYDFVKINQCVNKEKCNGKNTQDSNADYIFCTWFDVICKHKRNVK